MVEHLLSHAGLTAGRYAIEPDWRSLHVVLTEAARMMQPIAKKSGISLSAPMEPSLEINVNHHGVFHVLNWKRRSWIPAMVFRLIWSIT